MQHLRHTYAKVLFVVYQKFKLTRCPVLNLIPLSWKSFLWQVMGLFWLISSRDDSFSLQPDLLGFSFGNSESETFLPSSFSRGHPGAQIQWSPSFAFWQWDLSLQPDPPSGQVPLWGRERQFCNCVNSFKPPESRLVGDILRIGMRSVADSCVQGPHIGNVDIYQYVDTLS